MPRSLDGAVTLGDVARFLGVTENFLRFVLYGRRDRQKYKRFHIPKKRGGHREISAPPPSLKIMQRKIATALLALHPPKPSSHGFLRGRSVVSNARRHEGQRVVGNIDLQDFFPTIHLGRIVRALENPPFGMGEDAARVVAQVCCDENGRLPQGAPSSPIVSNIICRTLDDRLQQLARQHGCRYTRYADDITFSTSRPALSTEILYHDPITGIPVAGAALQSVISSSGFAINHGKVRIALSERRQEVTGLTTNERANVGRWFVRELDSLIHIWRIHGAESATASFTRRHRFVTPDFTPAKLISFLRGKLSYVQMVKGEHDPICRRLQWALSDLAGSPVPPPLDLLDLRPVSLSGRKGRFRGWQSVTEKYVDSIKLVEVKVGEDFACGSAFVVDSDTLVTAGHNVAAGPLRIYDGDEAIYPKRIYYVNVPGAVDCALLLFDGHPFAAQGSLHFQYRLPEIGEHVAAMGFPQVAYREPTVVLHVGAVEALPKSLARCRFIQTGFQGGGGLSGGPLVDEKGMLLGLMVENVFMEVKVDESEGKKVGPLRAYGQAVPYEYVARIREALRKGGESSLEGLGVRTVVPEGATAFRHR